jgi:1,4-alpha-glucan branching enzyme
VILIFWTQGEHQLEVRWDSSGIWEGFIPNIEQGTIYKYKIESTNNGIVTEKQILVFIVKNLRIRPL